MIQIAKADLVDDLYNKIQLQSELEINFFSKVLLHALRSNT